MTLVFLVLMRDDKDNIKFYIIFMAILENIKIFLKQINSKDEQAIARIMFNKSMTISVAESCTGGLVSSRLTDIAGSSVYIKENYVTYANEVKTKILGVSEEILDTYGAVSEECAIAMAEGLFARTESDIALSTTGIAGPGGATEGKNVGLIFVAIKNKYSIKVKKFEFNPKIKRKTMKYMFSQAALEFLLEFLKENDEKIKKSNIEIITEDGTEEQEIKPESVIEGENEIYVLEDDEEGTSEDN